MAVEDELELVPFMVLERHDENGDLVETVTGLKDGPGDWFGVMTDTEDGQWPDLIVLPTDVWSAILQSFLQGV